MEDFNLIIDNFLIFYFTKSDPNDNLSQYISKNWNGILKASLFTHYNRMLRKEFELCENHIEDLVNQKDLIKSDYSKLYYQVLIEFESYLLNFYDKKEVIISG